MSQSNELTQKILKFLFLEGVYAWRASQTGVYDTRRAIYRTAPKKGVADILACYKGYLVAIEVKIGKDKLSPEQAGFLKSIRQAGGRAFVATSYAQFIIEWQLLTTSFL